jgi:hypothetical protein
MTQIKNRWGSQWVLDSHSVLVSVLGAISWITWTPHTTLKMSLVLSQG